MALGNEHGVAVAEEAVAVGDCLLISAEDFFSAVFFSRGGEGADQHEKSRSGEVEVGEEGVHDFKIAGRVDEDFCAGGARVPVVASGAFEDAQGCCADGDDALPGAAGLFYFSECLLRNLEALFVHAMVFDAFRFYRSESAGANVQSHKSGLDFFVPEL